MKIQTSLYLLLTILLLASCKITKQETVSENLITKQFQIALDSIYKANPTSVGLMVHVESPDQNISWSGAVGLSDQQNKTRIQIDQPALIASNTKSYVAVAILRLIEENKLELHQSIENLISAKTKMVLEKDGYDLSIITVANLLSHTGGINNYANEEYLNSVDTIRKHRWTRDEQIKLMVDLYEPLGKANFTFRYADTNYLLLTEILEKLTNKIFYTAIRDLIDYDANGLNATWFISLEDEPKNIKPLIHQYWGQFHWDSYDIDPSFDLYGGGGIACTTKDLAKFSQALFEGKLIKNSDVLNMIYTDIKTEDEKSPNYYLGIMEGKVKEFKVYGHGGFWGTAVNYFPELNTSIAVFVTERDKRILRRDILESLAGLINEHRNSKK